MFEQDLADDISVSSQDNGMEYVAHFQESITVDSLKQENLEDLETFAGPNPWGQLFLSGYLHLWRTRASKTP